MVSRLCLMQTYAAAEAVSKLPASEVMQLKDSTCFTLGKELYSNTYPIFT